MGDEKLLPAIGYKGGKRALLPHLAPLFPISEMECYVEPFVGMGALYLHLRANGYKGPAVLCDSHPEVNLFWRYVHDAELARELLSVVESMVPHPLTRELFEIVRGYPCDGATRVAHFLWLTNLSFANNPARYIEDRWKTEGSKFSTNGVNSAGAWASCVSRLREIVRVVQNTNTIILEDGITCLAQSDGSTHIFADPPYLKTHQLGYGDSTDNVDFLAAIESANAKRMVLSEKADIRDRLPEWKTVPVSVAQRASQGKGSVGRRDEFIYVRDR